MLFNAHRERIFEMFTYKIVRLKIRARGVYGTYKVKPTPFSNSVLLPNSIKIVVCCKQRVKRRSRRSVVDKIKFNR
jgi:hypothetical protein